MPRWWLRCIVVLATGLALTVVVTLDPGLSFAFDAPVLRAVLETAVTIVAILVAFLLFGRYRRQRVYADLAIAVAMTVIALNYPLFVAVPLLGPTSLQDAGSWVYLIAHASAAALLCWAGAQQLELVGPRLPSAARPQARLRSFYTVTMTAVVCLAFLVFFGFDPNATRSGTTPHLFGDPATSAVRLASCALFFAAAAGFCWRNRSGRDHLIGWLAVGCALLAVGDLQYGLYPPMVHNEVHLGDVFRLAAVLVFAIGAAEEINTYWYESRQLARLQERRALARDLHDSVAQELVFLSAHAQSAVGEEARGEAQGVWLEQLRAATDRALAESRRAIAALVNDRPLALVADLDETVREIAYRAGVAVEVDVQPSALDRLDRLQREVLVRIVREAVVNAVRHSRPTLVRVALDGEELPVLRVVDDGIGFDPSQVDGTRRFGIVGMGERARSIGAHLTIESRRGHGTTLEVSWLPVAK